LLRPRLSKRRRLTKTRLKGYKNKNTGLGAIRNVRK